MRGVRRQLGFCVPSSQNRRSPNSGTLLVRFITSQGLRGLPYDCDAALAERRAAGHDAEARGAELCGPPCHHVTDDSTRPRRVPTGSCVVLQRRRIFGRAAVARDSSAGGHRPSLFIIGISGVSILEDRYWPATRSAQPSEWSIALVGCIVRHDAWHRRFSQYPYHAVGGQQNTRPPASEGRLDIIMPFH